MCEWGAMKRTVEAVQSGQRPAKIVALGAAMTRMAIVTYPASGIYEPEQLKELVEHYELPCQVMGLHDLILKALVIPGGKSPQERKEEAALYAMD